MAEALLQATSMRHDALRDALRLLGAAQRGAPADPLRARHAQRAVLQESGRLRAAGQAHVHLDAVALACAQLAAGLSPGQVKLAACAHILEAHLPGTGRAQWD